MAFFDRDFFEFWNTRSVQITESVRSASNAAIGATKILQGETPSPEEFLSIFKNTQLYESGETFRQFTERLANPDESTVSQLKELILESGLPSDIGNFIQAPAVENVLGEFIDLESIFPPVEIDYGYSYNWFSWEDCPKPLPKQEVNICGEIFKPGNCDGCRVLISSGG